MSEELQHIIPIPAAQIRDTFAAYQTTSQFYQEVRSRHALNTYCAWYYDTAKRHRQELQQMRGELNILSWFRGGKKR
ncbi:hypothetical protein [Aliterella atlantica]|uniref:Uncharacterized protein n=1 Tax=Aliterella atlantica CENA595 TaxID=1618023 RepID=A0A0D9A1C8_9CYAN|nr:hypothetical protein [Aliterella atlantica]KJH73261.1 hypothetical protein UH38_00150 [Aliterella atlantica CENA595]